MADIELVIKVPEEDYLTFSKLSEKEKINKLTYYEKMIAYGKLLPKGHGKIGDLTKLYNEIDKRNKGKDKGKYTGILALVTFADTIIEADKGE